MSFIHMQAVGGLRAQYAMVAGVTTGLQGYDNGTAAIGSLTPDILKGVVINQVVTVDGAPGRLQLTLAQANLGQTFFSSMEIVGQGTFRAGDATYIANVGGQSVWQWFTPGFVFVNAQAYTVVIIA